MAGGGRGTGTPPDPYNGYKLVTDKAGNIWRWNYKNGKFQNMEYVEKQDPPVTKVLNTADNIIDYITEYWQAFVIGAVALLILLRS